MASRSTPVQSALSVNAGFSAASGLILAIAPGAIGSILGIGVDGPLRAFGVVLLLHAALLFAVVVRLDVVWWGRLNLAVIAPYPVVMLAVAMTITDNSTGRALVLADGAAIAMIAAMLAIGLRDSARVPAAA